MLKDHTMSVMVVFMLFSILRNKVSGAEHPLKNADYARLSHTSAVPVFAKTFITEPRDLYTDSDDSEDWNDSYWNDYKSWT